MKRCDKCARRGNSELFVKDGNRRRRRCKRCHNEYCRLRRDNAAAKLRVHGLTAQEYQDMAKAQGNRCAVCCQPETALNTNGSGKVADLTIDHCHASGRLRGLLCRSCNLALGHFKDNPDTMRAAINYIAVQL